MEDARRRKILIFGRDTGKAIANNEKMANMMRGRLMAGQIKDVSEKTAAKMVGAGVTSSTVPATAVATTCKVSQKC
jgi:hypothetical protein